MSSEEDLVDVVDELADLLDPPRVQSEADRLGVSVKRLLDRIIIEVQDRLA